MVELDEWEDVGDTEEDYERDEIDEEGYDDEWEDYDYDWESERLPCGCCSCCGCGCVVDLGYDFSEN